MYHESKSNFVLANEAQSDVCPNVLLLLYIRWSSKANILYPISSAIILRLNISPQFYRRVSDQRVWEKQFWFDRTKWEFLLKVWYKLGHKDVGLFSWIPNQLKSIWDQPGQFDKHYFICGTINTHPRNLLHPEGKGVIVHPSPEF